MKWRKWVTVKAGVIVLCVFASCGGAWYVALRIREHAIMVGTRNILVAAGEGKTEAVGIWLRRGVNPQSQLDRALCNAAAGGHTSTAQLLLERGANINPVRPRGQTPLSMAAAGGHIGTAQLLLDHGANINPVRRGGETPLCKEALGGATRWWRSCWQMGPR